MTEKNKSNKPKDTNINDNIEVSINEDPKISIDNNGIIDVDAEEESIQDTNIEITVKESTKLEVDNLANTFIEQLKVAETVAKFVAESKTYRTPYIENILDGDGNIIKKVVNTSDIVAAILLGNEIGFTPMQSVLLGKQLSVNSFQCVLKGKALGLDPINALHNIKPIPSGGGLNFHTGVHIMEKLLIDSGVVFTILEDFHPYYWYCQPNGNILSDEEVEESLADKGEITLKLDRASIIKLATTGKAPIIKRRDFRTTIRYVRESKGIDVTFKFTLQEAIDAGWARGYHSSERDDNDEFVYSKGRDNWNRMPRIMTRNRNISLAANIVIADRLQGALYTNEEAQEIKG